MNWELKAASFFNPQTRTQCCSHLRLALFHSTPVLEHKRTKSWNPKKKPPYLLRNVNAYADYILQDFINDEDPSSSRGTSWFKRQYYRSSKKQRDRNHRTRCRGRKGFQFSDEYEDIIFRSTFGRDRSFYSFMNNEEDSWWRNSREYSNRRYQSKWDHDSNTYGRNWSSWFRNGYNSSSKFDSSESHLASDRLALGLTASGPLKLKDVKAAFRACALKWHPDRHQGSSKAVAEEKFKVYSAAYESLCDKLAAA